ncbi:mechanosensitive ion channel domain-containing protein [Planctomycetota bacterium]
MNSAIFAACLITSSSVCLGAEPLKDVATSPGGGQDANTVSQIVPISQGVPSANVSTQLTSKEIRAIRKQINESQELSEEVKAKIGDVYDKAIAQLTSAAEYEEKKQRYNQTRKEVPGTLAKTKELLAQQATIAPPEAGPQTTLIQAEQALTAARLALEEAKKNVENWENEPKRRAERRTRIPEESNNAKQKLDEISTQLAAPVTEGQAAELAQANRALLLAQQRALESQIASNTEELLFYDAAGDLLAARRDLAARQLTSAERVIEFWQQKVNDLRQKEAETAQKEAIRAKEKTKYPVIQAIAEKNAELAGIQAELAAKIEDVTKYSDVIDANLAAVKRKYEEIRTKVETAGKVTDVLGTVLIAHRDKLPSISSNLRRIKGRASKISLAQFHAMERDREWSDLSNLADEIDAVLAQLDPSVDEAERESIKKQATSYYESQRKTLQAITNFYGNYSAMLANLDTRERQYVETVQEYADFIDANIFWVKSSPPLRLSDLRTSISAIGWLLSGANWLEAAGFLWTDFKNNASVYLAALLVVVLLVVLHPKAHGAITVLSEQVHKAQTDSFAHTLKTLALTVFLAATWPIFLFLFQWRWTAAAPNHDFSQAMASGLMGLVPVVFMLCFLRHFAMPLGLAQDHLRMRQEPLSFFRRLLGWYFALAIPVIMIVRIMHVQQTNEQWYNSAGRLFFMIHLVVLALLQLLLLRPTGPLMEPFLKQGQGGWLKRLRYLWYPLCFILPVTFAVLAGIGYFYAAQNLFVKLVVTILLILLMILVRAMFVRWLMVARRRLALLELQKREAAEQEIQEQGESATTTEQQQSKSRDDGTTIFQTSQQTRRLIDAITVLIPLGGIWYVWNDVLPALKSLAEIELWRLGGAEAVTLGSLAMALFVVALTVIATRNAPGLLEIVILRRLPFDRGVRFAIITLFRYTLAVIGIVLAFGKIGIGWSKVQWLVAAMTVGLGFGLQEIFANFVSGLIILFEQPIRVDDVVTIGEVTGKVAKIRIRATTIRRWDQRELVVPNKEFITGHLVNWTLSDNVLRREFVVGIAYGSDIVKAERILYEVARANPLVLKDPAPVVLFTSFGNSSLEFELRVFIAGIDNYIPVWHSINCAIDTEFRKAGIEIAFPQRDIHVRSIDATIPIHTKPSSSKHAESE